jgi:tRNA(Ile)-lysidine synthase
MRFAPRMPADLTPQRLLATLAELPTTDRYWVAYSGGLDSHVLLHAMAGLRAQLGGAEVRAVHVNHGLQGDADAWAGHCRSACERLAVACVVLEVEARPAAGQSPEAAARQVRYETLASAMCPGDVMLTAHHQDDQAETVLLHLLRGSGPHGLAAMGPWRVFGPGWLGRPLLELPRAALRAYAEGHGLHWVDDPSNREDRFERNFLRHEVVPTLKRRWPSLTPVLARVARHQADAAQLMDDLGDMDLEQVGGPTPDTLSVAHLQALGAARQRNALRRWFRSLALPLPTTRHLHHVVRDLLGAAQDAMPRVGWEGAEVRRYRGLIYAMVPLDSADPSLFLTWQPREPLSLPLGALVAEPVTGRGLRAECIDHGGLVVRFRQGGERCQLPGRIHSQSLKKLLQARGLPPWLREHLPLLYVAGQLAAVGDLWVCEPFLARQGEAGYAIEWRRGKRDWRLEAGDRKRETRNKKRKMKRRKEERGTGNEEPGTRNQEPGTRNAERGTRDGKRE